MSTPNADSMPQVQVALRELARGKTVRKGDVVSYIITGDSKSSDPAAKRAYTPADVLKPDSAMTPDVEWYIGKQIFPPVERLCANVSGTSTAQLAENLGLDVRRYQGPAGGGHASGGGNDLEIHPLESQIPMTSASATARASACAAALVRRRPPSRASLPPPRPARSASRRQASPARRAAPCCLRSPSWRRWSTPSARLRRATTRAGWCATTDSATTARGR